MSSAPTPVPITVNFNVEIDASGNLNVFNAAAPEVTNVIVAEHKLPVNALYDSVNRYGLIELWEPSTAQGDIHVQLANTMLTASGGLDLSGQYQIFAKRLASGLETILCDSFDCSQASPFSNYTSDVEYYKQRDFGRVALATYAHYLFGHVDATAAITNDKAFVEGVLSLSGEGDSEVLADRVNAWTKSVTDNVQLWNNTSSGTDANLAIRLVKALIQKGLSDTSATATLVVSSVNEVIQHPESLAKIVAQVVGQDASRLMDYDNSQRTRDQHIALRFYAGDVIYMNIRLRAPSVNVGATNQQVLGSTLENMYSEENFTLKITLEDVAPVTSGYFTYSDSTNTVVTGYVGTPAGGHLIVPEGVVEIADLAFFFNTGITSVTLPSTLTTIGAESFVFTGISSITIPNSVLSIGNSAFASCPNLTEFTIKSSITYGEYLLTQCSNLTTVTIENGVTSIPPACFNGCAALTTVTIPSSVTTIGFEAFLLCTGLTSITIPSSVTMIEFSAFYGCNQLSSVNLSSGLVTISEDTFNGCTALSTIVIPSTVTTIEQNAFSGCTGLSSITLSSNLTEIQTATFNECIALTSITIPSSVTYIRTSAFIGSGLTSITIPTSVTVIEGYAFAYCTSLSIITIPVGCVVDPTAFTGTTTTIRYDPVTITNFNKATGQITFISTKSYITNEIYIYKLYQGTSWRRNAGFGAITPGVTYTEYTSGGVSGDQFVILPNLGLSTPVTGAPIVSNIYTVI